MIPLDFDPKPRCFVDPETDCWHWLGTLTRGAPSIQIKRKRYRVARLVKLIKPGRYVSMKCGQADCVNPAHIRTVSRSEYVKAAIANRKPLTFVERRRNRAASAKLNEQKAREIRELRTNGLSLRQLGRRFGVNYQTVQNVVTNRTWREASPWAI
jgi:DNA-directed RNA polymerase specialized sigma24 family protein